MGFPEYKEMDEPLLCFIFLNGGDQHRVRPATAYRPLADYFGLTDEERSQQRSDGYGGTQWQNRVQWARQRLINHGYLDGHERGFWRLTADGLTYASNVAARYSELKTAT